MKRIPCVVVVAIAIVVASSVLAAQQWQAIPQEQMVEWLGSDRLDMREAVISYVLKAVGPEKRTPALDQALAEELARLNEMRRLRIEHDRAGAPLVDDFPAEYHASVVQAVSQSANPVGIPALAGALGTGRMVEDALARFGEQALPAVLAVAQQKAGRAHGDTPPEVTYGSLQALRRLMERNPNLSFAARAKIVQVADRRLRESNERTIIAAACELAVATGDSALRRRVERLATDRTDLAKRGLDSWSVDFVQRVARQSLAAK